LEVDAATSELFGVRIIAGSSGAARRTIYKSLGKPGLAGPLIVVRSFKGHVSAVLQK
jgi:hypothetical protein